MDTFGFDVAIKKLLAGEKIRRKSWNEQTQYVMLTRERDCIHTVNSNSPEHIMENGYFLIFVGINGYKAPWNPTQYDLLAKDWMSLLEGQEIGINAYQEPLHETQYNRLKNIWISEEV